MSDHDHVRANIESLGASPDPVKLAGRWRRESHPLFPRDDGSPEDRDIQFITFRRRRTGDRLVQNYPEDIPAHEVLSWAQVVAWWGGGEYKVLGKNADHELVAVHPPSHDGWECFDGDSKPFTFRDGSPYAGYPAAPNRVAEAPKGAASVAPAPAASSGLEALVIELVREVRASRAAPPAPPTPPAPPPAPAAPAGNDTGVLIALINAQAQTARDFQAQMQAAAARESENMRAMMVAMLNQRSAEAKPAADAATVALSLLNAVRDFTQSAPQSSVAETISQFKVLKELTTTAPAAPAAPASAMSEIGEIFSGLTTLIQADATTRAAASAAELARPAPPERRAPPRSLFNVPGLGVGDVLHPEAVRAAAQVMSAGRAEGGSGSGSGFDIEAVKRDPGLRAKVLAELGVEVSAGAVSVAAAPSGVSATAPAPSTAPAPAEVSGAGVSVVEGARSEAAQVKGSAPGDIESGAARKAASEVSSAPAQKAAKPEAAAVAEPALATDDARMLAVHALRTIARMPAEQRRAEIRKLPGMGEHADAFTQALGHMESLPAEEWTRLAASLPADAVRVLVEGPRG